MIGAANNVIVRRERPRFDGSRRAAVFQAALACLARNANAKRPRWQTGKSSGASAIKPLTTRNALGENAGLSKARENSATCVAISQKPKVDARSGTKRLGSPYRGAVAPLGSKIRMR